MAEKKYYTIEEAAAYLGITPAEVNLRREHNELRGLRDGSNWKFKGEDIESLARRMRTEAMSAATDDDTNEVLLSEVALGGSDAGTSGTVIGGTGKAADSDLRLAESDIRLGESDVGPQGSGSKKGAGSGVKKGGSGVDLAGAAKKPPVGAGDLELTIDEELLLDEDLPLEIESKPATPVAKKPGSSVIRKQAGSLSGKKTGSGVGKKAGGSGIGGGDHVEDDDLVLGAPSGGSDVTIGSDSGISLVDPTDSGLSLEEPLELDREEEDDDSLELGEDDMLTFADDTGASIAVESEAAPVVQPEEGFQLTPLEEVGDEDSESGSQVIALEGGPVSDAAPTMIAGGAMPMAAAMLDEDFGGGASAGLGAAVPAAGSPLGMPQPVYADQGAVAAPSMIYAEAPYSGLQVTSLVFCVILLVLCGWMGYDLLRNMWSWGESYTVTSSLMDMLAGLLG